MIILGILALVLGGILLLNGNSINNDLDAQMESILNNGISNPGSTYETFGILLLVVGFALLIIGVFVYVNKKGETPQVDNTRTSEEKSPTCKNCGVPIDLNDMFCPHCGKMLHQSSEWLCKCGNVNKREANFCSACGSPRVEPPAPTPWVCSNCGSENKADYIFCTNCRTLRKEGKE